MIKIMTVRFDENLGISLIQGEVTLNCEKIIRMIENKIPNLRQKSSKTMCFSFCFIVIKKAQLPSSLQPAKLEM